MLDAALHAGVIEFEINDDGKLEFLTEPQETAAITKMLSEALNVKVLSSNLAWIPKLETMARSADLANVHEFLGEYQTILVNPSLD